jgi:PAS domain S-box-containing protein
MLKARLKIILYYGLAGLFVWFVDEVIDYFVYYREYATFLDLLIFDIPPQELYIRTILMAAFLAFGVFSSKYIVSYKASRKEAESLARFPREDPSPVIRIGLDGRILFCNPAGEVILQKWKTGKGGKVPSRWKEIAGSILEKGDPHSEEIETAGGVFLVTAAPVVEHGYVNLYGVDISSYKRVMEEFQVSKKNLMESQRAVKIGTWDWDQYTGRLIWSDEVYRIFGVSAEEFIPGFEEHIGFVLEEDRAEYRRTVQKMLEQGKSFEYEVRIKTPNGALKTVWVRGDAKKDRSGRTSGLWGTIQDITERKKIEEEVREKERELSSLLGSMMNAFVVFESVFDEKGNFASYRFVYINEAYERITGVLNEEVEGKTVHEVWPETEPEWIEKYGSVAMSGRPSNFELYHGPTKKYYRCNVYRPWDDNKRFCVVFEDITEEINTIKRLMDSERLLNEVGRTAKIGGWEMDMTKGGSAVWTEAVYDIVEIGYDRPVPGYDEHLDYYLPSYREMVRQKMEKLAAEGGKMNFEAPLRTAGGHIKWCEAYGEAVAKDGEIVKLRGTFQDISERKKAEDALMRSKAGLEKTVKDRTAELEAFNYSVSHDLRAPLRSLKGFSDALVNEYGGRFDGSALDYITRIRKNAEKMTLLIDDMLMLSRVGRHQVIKNRVDLSRLCMEIIEEFKSQGPVRKTEIVIEKGLESGGDSELLGIALRNLLGNAWKFSGKKPVTRIEFGQKNTEREAVYFVKDEGEGFDARYAHKLFRPFQRLHPESEFPGTGIGLATVRRIIEKHGGHIWAESQPGKGAVFYFTLN